MALLSSTLAEDSLVVIGHITTSAIRYWLSCVASLHGVAD